MSFIDIFFLFFIDGIVIHITLIVSLIKFNCPIKKYKKILLRIIMKMNRCCHCRYSLIFSTN
jgi:hypothetical protein